MCRELFKRFFKRGFQSKTIALALGELPPRDIFEICERGEPERRYDAKTVHFTVIDGRVGRTNFLSVKQMRHRAPDSRFVCWDNEQARLFLLQYAPELGNKQEITNIPGIIISDLFRVAILAKYGGYYFDMKSGFKTELPSLSGFKAVFIAEDKSTSNSETPLIANWFMGGEAGTVFSSLFSFLCQNLTDTVRMRSEDFADYVKRTSGPRAVTSFLQNLSPEERDTIKIMDPTQDGEGLYYQCPRSWVRTIIHKHYSREA
jgi:hypothetical protein